MNVNIDRIRNGGAFTNAEQAKLVIWLALPGILAQISIIAMQYIDTAMLGRLGADQCAAVGLMATSCWLIGGFTHAVSAGFSVQVAQLIGANNINQATHVIKRALPAAILFMGTIGLIAFGISGYLPLWLGGTDEVARQASQYFRIYACGVPFVALNSLCGGILRASGNMKTPSFLNACMCALDVVFNYVFIYVMQLGVIGAALGTACAVAVTCSAMAWNLRKFWHSKFGRIIFARRKLTEEVSTEGLVNNTYTRAVKIGTPMAVQHIALCSAQILSTVIVAPLGVFAIAANSFAVTAESVCYMPGYGIAEAATTLVGQSKGAGRLNLLRRFAWVSVGLGVAVMSLMGILMFFCATEMMSILTNIPEIISQGAECLRIECFAEPLFAANIVCNGVLVGLGRTIAPCIMNFCSMYCVRLTLAWWLAPVIGLKGVWIAMAIELCFRGFIFLAYQTKVLQKQ